MARALILGDPKTTRRIQQVIDYADQHRYTIVRQEAGEVPGDNPYLVVNIPIGFRCVYSVTQDPENGRYWRHLSVSVDGRGKWPHPTAIGLLMEAFGFRGKHSQDEGVLLWVERDAEAINVAEAYP